MIMTSPASPTAFYTFSGTLYADFEAFGFDLEVMVDAEDHETLARLATNPGYYDSCG